MWKKGKNKENFFGKMEIWQENSATRWLDWFRQHFRNSIKLQKNLKVLVNGMKICLPVCRPLEITTFQQQINIISINMT